MKKIRVLYIDDERHNLSAFRAAFRQKYEIFIATGTLEAREILSKNNVHIIIADQRMPGTTGIEFFDLIKESYPDAIRILITAYTEVDALVDAINKGQIYRFIRKPWDYFDLQNTISNAYEIYVTKKDLDEKISELGKGQEELNRFLAALSIDLRAPLISALGLVNLSKIEESPEEIQKHLNLIEEKLKAVDGFIQKITKYHKDADVYPNYEEVHFQSFIDNCLQTFNGETGNVSFRVEVDQKSPFYGDHYRIHIVLTNLISNAINFMKPDIDQPEVKLLATVDENKTVLHVEDNGKGIKDHPIDKIFKLFYQPKENTGSGAGLGLYIAKEALTRMDGHISVASTPDQGTKFTVTIPNHSFES